MLWIEESLRAMPADFARALQTAIAASRTEPTTGRIKRHILKRYAAISFLSVLLLYVGSASFYRASRKHFWYDEVLTVAVTNQGSLAGIWNALDHAADGNPPLFYVIEGLSHRLAPDEHLGYRVPAILGFLCVPVALFWFTRTRLGDLAGLIATLLLLFTCLYSRYSIEARPYGLVVGIIAVALVVWQHTNGPRTALLLALLLGTATALHFYAVLALAPFALGEAFRTARLRQWRVHLWAAFGWACIPLIAFLPILWQVKQHFGAHFWARPAIFSGPSLFLNVLSVYVDLFGPERAWQAIFALGLITIAVAALITDAIQWNDSYRHQIPIEERVAMLGFALLPVLGCLAAFVTRGGIASRYLLPAVLGISFAFARLARRLGRSSSIVMLGVILCSFIFQEAHNWVLYGDQRKAQREVPADSQVLAELLDQSELRGLPVVVSDGLPYLPMAYYSGVQKKGDLFYLADPEKAVQYAKTDSLDRGLSIVSAYLPINVRQFPDFARQHNKFLLYSIDNTLWDWWPRRLRDDGYLIRPVAARLGRTLYFVDLRHKAISSVVSSP